MAVTVTYNAVLTVEETVAATNAPFAASGNQVYLHSLLNRIETLNASSTPAATKVAAYEKALSAGAATIDLTTHTGTNGAVQDFTGLKVRAFCFRNKSTNTGAITVKFGAATAYLLGGAAWTWILGVDQEIRGYCKDAAPAVSASLKNIDLAGTGTEILQVELVAG